MSASAKRRGITPQERIVAACPTRPRVDFDSVVHRRQRLKSDTAIVRQFVLLSGGQQFVDRIC